MLKLLIAEDNELNRDMLSRRLQRRGYAVVLASDGARCLEMVETERPDLVLLDMSLPVVDGWEVARRLKADERTRHIPVVALTAHAMAGDEARARAAGCDDFDTKPVDMPRLLSKLERWLGATPLRAQDTAPGFRVYRAPPPAELVLPATRASLGPLLEFTDLHSAALGLDPDTTFRVRLAVEEVCTNVINYAYEGMEPGPVGVRFRRQGDSLTVAVEDQGRTWDPRQVAPPRLDAGLEERPLGQLGWHLVHQVMDEVRHEALEGGGNRVTLRRRLAPTA